jgi:TolB-like protein/DNA-binding winged helix-turn-helix (wHTH) protein/Tfp pilus assembly protein PilF
MSTPKVKFGDFELDAAGYELSHKGHPIKLERIPMELLLLLVDHHGQLVTRDEILEKLWGKDTFLDADNSINTAISKIRLVLKDDPENPAFIKTLSGKGYRFIAPITVLRETQETATESAPKQGNSDGGRLVARVVDDGRAGDVAVAGASPLDSKSPPERRRWWVRFSFAGVVLAGSIAAWGWRDSLARLVSLRPSPVIRSLAVLPLENLTGDASQEYFADGMTDALITDLAQIATLRVISRTSIMRYKGVRKSLPEIARELGVDGIVEGTVVRSAGRIRITSQLIYAPSDQHLWARSYESDLSDVVKLQGEVAQAIAGQVRAALTAEERSHIVRQPTDSAEAYQLYLQGRYSWNQRTPRGVQKSVELFEQAVGKDPNFALAYAGIADAYNFTNILGVLAPRESSLKAEAAATKALALDPQLGEAHTALGLVKSHYYFDFTGAQREFLKALELNPNYANAHLFYAGAYLAPMGRHEEAIAEMKKALEVDPLSLPLNNMMGETYVWAGEYDRAQRQFQHTLDLEPTFSLAHFYYADLLKEMGRYEEGIKQNEAGDLLLGASPEEAGALAAEFQKALQAGGPKSYWQKNLEMTLKEYKRAGTGYFPAMGVASAYARVGDKENAFKWLDKSFQDREGQDITLVRWLPDFKSLHTDPRFADLLRRMGLPN